MPVQIGASAHDFSNPTGMLSDCHRRIELFLGSLEAVANVVDRTPTPEAKKALDAALRYFRESAPKHNEDEEESLFPRMRRIHDPGVASALAKLEELEKDHRWAAPLHAVVERVGRNWIASGSLAVAEAARFREAISALSRMYRRHIRVEDETVFPVAAKLLSEADRKAIGQEMAARRKVRISRQDRSRA